MRVDDDHGFLAMYPPLQTVENGQLPIPVHFLDYLGVFENMANLNGHSNRENDGSETSPLHEISRRWTPLALKEPKSQIKISENIQPKLCVQKKMVCETSKKRLGSWHHSWWPQRKYHKAHHRIAASCFRSASRASTSRSAVTFCQIWGDLRLRDPQNHGFWYKMVCTLDDFSLFSCGIPYFDVLGVDCVRETLEANRKIV